MPPFLITVDTEADNQWSGDGRVGLENLKAIPRFQAICEKYGFVPTYLVTYEVATDQNAVTYLKGLWDSGKAEIGAHLHPWTTPPFTNEGEEKSIMPFPSELDSETLRLKFIALHEQIEKAFGKPAKVFRAGRWGYDHRVGELLWKYGYVADVSITPLVDWGKIVKNKQGRVLPNFVHASIRPFVISGDLYELPMTVVPRGPRFVSRLANLLGRGSLYATWCRIFPNTSVAELLWVYERARALKLPYCQFMIHSSEFVEGSRYTKDIQALDHHFGILEEYLKELSERGVKGLTISQMRATLSP